MSFQLDPQERLDAEIRRISRERVDRALSEIDEQRPRKAAHEVRKACKKIRAVLRLVRPELGERYRPENVRFRDIARRMAPMRDAASLVEAVEALEDSSGRSFDGIKQALRDRRAEVEDDHACELPQVRCELENAKSAIEEWPLPARGFPQGIERPYRRGRRKLKKSQRAASAHRLHQWRKRAKYHRYHCGLLESTWPGPLEAREQEAHDLTDLLGEDHDLSELTKTLQQSPSRFGGKVAVGDLEHCAEQRQSELRQRALQLGAKLFADEPQVLLERLETYWRAA